MFKRSVALVIVGIFLGQTIAVVMAVPASRTTTQLRCDPIGRVLDQGGKRFPAGRLLCKGDRLTLASGVKVDFLCFLSRRILTLLGGTVFDADECVPNKVKVRSCSVGDTSNCPKPKGPDSGNNEPAIVSPYSSALLNNRPRISWYAVAGATSYTVEVSGEGIQWGKTVKSTTLGYPNEQPALQFGNAYKVTVIAHQSDSPISASVSIFNMLPETEARQVMELAKRINSLKLPKDEVAYLDLDAIYMSKNLLDETINTLEARIRAGSQNPSVYRTLGDRYLEAGLPDRAKVEYEIASNLAQTANNPKELAKARAGLELIARVSIPIRLPRLEP